MAYVSADERRRLIVDAAVDVIAAEGLAQATTRRIAERAQMPLSSLHYCFRNKNELIMLVLERGGATMRTGFDELDPATGFQTTLRSIVTCYWHWIRDHLGLHLALMELVMWVIRNKELISPDPDIWSDVNAPLGGDLIESRLTTAAEREGIRLALPVREVSRFLIHRMEGLVFEYAETMDEASCERQVQLLADALVTLCLPPSPVR